MGNLIVLWKTNENVLSVKAPFFSERVVDWHSHATALNGLSCKFEVYRHGNHTQSGFPVGLSQVCAGD